MRSEVQVLPAEFLDRLKRILPTNRFDAIANTFSEPKPTTFRVNTLKSSTKAVREILETKGFRLENVSWYPDAFILRDGRLRELQETEIYKTGQIYVQNLSSMIPPLVLDPQPGETILDLTAAPGSKTTQIASLMKNEGMLYANDNDKVRFFKLKANTDLQGVTNVKLSLRYGEAFGRDFPNRFDRVLLDAPCSAEGRFNVREPASYRFWKPKKVNEMAHKQRKLMFSALSALRPGGVLVYSTCTFAPEENESVLQSALKKSGHALTFETISLPFPNQMAGIGVWGKETFDPAVKKSLRILPNAQMEGFFVARIRKQESS